MRRSVSPVNNDNVQWQHSSHIPKYTNTVWQCGDLFSCRNSPAERRCYFGSHPVKPACAIYCVPYYFSIIMLQWLVSKMSLVMWTCWQTGIIYVHLWAQTIGDPTWAIVFRRYRDLASHRVSSHVSPFKNSPVRAITTVSGHMHAHKSTHGRNLETNKCTHLHTAWLQSIWDDLILVAATTEAWGLDRCVSLNTLLSYLHTPLALDLNLHLPPHPSSLANNTQTAYKNLSHSVTLKSGL